MAATALGLASAPVLAQQPAAAGHAEGMMAMVCTMGMFPHPGMGEGMMGGQGMGGMMQAGAAASGMQHGAMGGMQHGAMGGMKQDKQRGGSAARLDEAGAMANAARPRPAAEAWAGPGLLCQRSTTQDLLLMGAAGERRSWRRRRSVVRAAHAGCGASHKAAAAV
jgi:hypothetical protein